MTTATLDKLRDKQEVIIPAPELRGAVTHLFDYPELEIGCDGPAGTGKTFGILYAIHVLLLTYPKAKWLIARKRNTDLAGSALAEFRENILDDREGVIFFGGSKAKPAGYVYPNGSFLAVNGLDRPGKVKSMDFDGIYINEATECTIDDIETSHIRLARRKGSALPERFQKLIMDFNPDAPEHFLNLRMNEGTTRRLLSRHEDNPFLYDALKQEWTEAGIRYIRELETLTGVRLARYRYGMWAASEGTVYEDSWNRARNVIKPFYIPAEWPRYLWIDYGFTNPFVCQWAARDDDGRLYVYREIYKTKMIVEDHCTMIKAVSRWGQPHGDPLPREIICDHDAEDRATMERHLGLRTTPAHKGVSDGIQAMAARLRPAADGKPRLMYFENALVERDRDLAARKKPTCTVEEFDSYVWEETASGIKEVPKKENDHGCDCSRYGVARFDVKPREVQYSRRVI
jgi:PBSX family phage terminase large subunit